MRMVRLSCARVWQVLGIYARGFLVLQYEAGVTPNPDLACNRHIKFGALLEHCKGLGADMVATGHYARIAKCGQSGQLQLLRGLDPLKDQSYFLASVHGDSLAGEALFIMMHRRLVYLHINV